METDPDAKGKALLGQSMSGGYLQPLTPDASKEQQTAVLNDIISRLNNILKTQVYADNSSKRFIQGYAKDRWPGGDFGMAISAEGDDVTTVEFENLIFAWDFTTNIQYVKDGRTIYYTGTNPNVLVGGAPDDGRGGLWVTKPGQNVITKLGG